MNCVVGRKAIASKMALNGAKVLNYSPRPHLFQPLVTMIVPDFDCVLAFVGEYIRERALSEEQNFSLFLQSRRCKCRPNGNFNSVAKLMDVPD